MLLEPPTEAELERTFNKVLAAIVDGQLDGCPSDTGLRTDVIALLDGVAKADNRQAASVGVGNKFKKEQATAALRQLHRRS
jgi:hypothetical protein